VTTCTVPHTPPPEHDPEPGWGQSLANGAAGLALLHIGYAHAGIGNWGNAHQWVKAMTRGGVAADPNASLYRGAPAVAYVLRTAGLAAYHGVLWEIDEHIAAITRARLQRAHERIESGALPALREFDLINGLTGLGVYLLHVARTDPHHPGAALLRDVLAYLVRLTGQITVDGATLPGWWTAAGPSGRPDPRWPGGHANLGVAHGIAGPLALLSAAMIGGITVPGQAEAIELTDWWLSSWRCGTDTRPWWPGMISAREWADAAVDQPGPQRPSWCYGTPGIARALHLAAQALDAPTRAAEARAALIACITDNAQLNQLGDDTLCHGWAGLVHTARRMLADTEPGSEAAEALARLGHRWQDRRAHAAPKLLDPCGMLEGGAGVALTDLPASTGWDACLLTAPPTGAPIGSPESVTTYGRNRMTSSTGAATSIRPEDLREQMISHIRTVGHLRSERIEQAFRAVPRHRFVPAASVEEAYANKAITIKPGKDRPTSCISVPTVVAMMLGQLDPQPGDRVLEIGAGTGYNAALLAELVGDTGSVTTVDIHPDVTDHARHALAETGYDRVQVVTGDGALGEPDHAPYDKIIVTVGPWDLPPAWFDQLAPGGILVVPLHWRGQARSVAFVRHDTHLRAENSQLCGFIPMIGIVPTGEKTGNITEHVALHWDTDQNIDPAALAEVFTEPETTVWAGASVVANEPFDHIWLWLTATEPGTCRLDAEDEAIEAGLCRPAFSYRTPAIVEGGSLAYLTKPRPVDDPDGGRRYELGATGHGPAAVQLAERLVAQIRRFDRDRTAQPVITAYPAATADEDLPAGVVIDKHHVRMVVTP
jgi:protein-L-isoaspartate(D-aspartate) O-methyltransferase